MKNTLSKPKNKEIMFDGRMIKIRPYLTVEDQVEMINSFLQQYFYPDTKWFKFTEVDVLGSEIALKLDIIGRCSDVDPKIEVLETGFFNALKEEIINYPDFRFSLEEIVKNVKDKIEQNSSLGTVVDGLASRAEELVSSISETFSNFNPEDIKKLRELGKELIEEVKSSPLAAVIGEAEKEKLS